MASGIDRSRVIPGEADESEEDCEVTDLMSPMSSLPSQQNFRIPQQGTVVSGEASESDDEITNGSAMPSYFSDYDLRMSSGQRSRRSSRENSSKMDLPQFDEPKYNTLLHKKLRERNLGLRRDLVDVICQPYQTAAKEISAISQQLIKSQLLVQEVSCTLRRLTNELFQLEDKVDTIRSCNLLPEILIASMPPEES